MENLVIIGSGPAGISASLYTARSNLSPLVISKGIGALEKAEKIDNFYGSEEGLTGPQLHEKDWEFVFWRRKCLGFEKRKTL